MKIAVTIYVDSPPVVRRVHTIRIQTTGAPFHTTLVKLRFTVTSFYYGQFAVSMGKESPYIFSKCNPLSADTLSIRAVSISPPPPPPPPSESVLKEFYCSCFCQEQGTSF